MTADKPSLIGDYPVCGACGGRGFHRSLLDLRRKRTCRSCSGLGYWLRPERARPIAPSISTVQIRGVVALLWPDEITPIARRILLSLCEQVEEDASE